MENGEKVPANMNGGASTLPTSIANVSNLPKQHQGTPTVDGML